MRMYSVFVIGFCVFYFFAMAMYSGRLISTFTMFWPACAAGHFLIYLLWPYTGRHPVIQICFFAVYLPIVLLVCITAVIILIYARRKPGCIPEYVIVLGAQIRGKRLTQSLLFRLEKAAEIANKYPSARIVTSGGQGKGEDLPEAEAMADYLCKSGIEKSRIIEEKKSVNTKENILLSLRLIGEAAEYAPEEVKRLPIGIITNSFHCFRAGMLAKKLGLTCVCIIPASSNRMFYINYVMRESAAVWGNLLRDRSKFM